MTAVGCRYYFLKEAQSRLSELVTIAGKLRDEQAVFEIFWLAQRWTRSGGLKNQRKVSSSAVNAVLRMTLQLALWSFQRIRRLNFSNFLLAMDPQLDSSLCLWSFGIDFSSDPASA